MKLCFVTNNISTKNDELTTYDMAFEAFKRGHPVYFAGVQDFHSEDNNIVGNLIKLEGVQNPLLKKRSDLVDLIAQTNKENYEMEKMDVLFLRHKYKKRQKIPEELHKSVREYAFHLSEKGVFVLNDPKYLPFASSKLATLGLEKSILAQKQLVSCNFDQLYSFCDKKLNFQGVLKSVSGSGGDDIFFIDKKNLRNTLTKLLEGGQVVAQSYIQSEGDKRILLLEGEPIGWYMRVSGEKEGLHNIHAGGKAVKCDLSKRDYEIISKIRPRIIKYKMYFVGVDILGGFLSEINSENPGGTIRCDMLGGSNSRGKVIDFLESKVKQK